MNFSTTIERISPDGLMQECWCFCDDGQTTSWLDYHLFSIRKTKRHGWRIKKSWYRMARDNDRARPTTPQDVIDELRKRITDAITIN